MYLAVAEEFATHEVPFETASAYLGAARCLIAEGRDAEAREPLAIARELFEGLGAAPSLAEVAALEGR